MKGLLIFFSGVAVGAIGSMLYIQKFVIPELREEVEKEQSATIVSDIPEDPKEKETEEPETISYPYDSNAKERVNEIKKEQHYLDYTKFTSVTDVPEAKFKEKEEKSEAVVTEEEQTAPYIIDEESFDEFSGYRAITFEVYSDGVIIDSETQEELDADPELVFGKTAVDALENDPSGIVCVRDDTKKCDYRLERIDYPADGPDISSPPEINWG